MSDNSSNKNPSKENNVNQLPKSNLSPFAKEFVPQRLSEAPRIPSVQTGNAYPSSYNGVNFNNTTVTANGDIHDLSKHGIEYEEPDEYVALNELKEFIDTISSQPAQYDNSLDAITQILKEGMEDEPELVMECVVNTIVDQAIMDTNFRYNGARLCIHLMDNLKITTRRGTFEDILLSRCQREHNRREILVVATDGGLYLRGVALFIADLSIRSFGNKLIKTLPELIDTLIVHPTTENLKCACMILKLTGARLDEFLKSKQDDQQYTQVMDKIIDRLKSFLNTPSANSSTKALIKNVIQLRENNWTSVPVQSNPVIVNPYASGDFNPPICDNLNPYDGLYPSYDFGPCGDGGDKDVCDAFEEFLRSSGQLP